VALIGDFLLALGQIGDRRFLGVVLKSLALTIALLGGMTALAGWLAGHAPADLGDWPLIGPVTLPSLAAQGLAVGAVLVASTFLMIPVAALFVGFFLDDIAYAVDARHYPNLPARRRDAFLEDMGSALRSTVTIILVNAAALLPYLIFLLAAPPLAVALIYGINGYLLGREYFDLVAARRMSTDDARRLRRANWMRVWSAGILMTLPLTIPIINLIVPVLGVATLTHLHHRLTGVRPRLTP